MKEEPDSRTNGFTRFSLSVLFNSSGCKLSEFERVTALKVYNWFANRRKEMKRRANIGEDLITDGALDTTGGSIRSLDHLHAHLQFMCPCNPHFLFFLTQLEAAILESHGIEVPSPSCHSNGEEGELQEFADQVSHWFSEFADMEHINFYWRRKTSWPWSWCCRFKLFVAQRITLLEICMSQKKLCSLSII